jgi:hypothetical protein
MTGAVIQGVEHLSPQKEICLTQGHKDYWTWLLTIVIPETKPGMTATPVIPTKRKA